MQQNQARFSRLPGVRFEVQAPALDESLPRMDVTGFVGFASKGPVHRPVPLEDIGQFEAIFGQDLPLAWDAKRGEQVYAHLAGSVRAFFRNGGQRCWVVRVADVGTARANVFTIPGVVRLEGSEDNPKWVPVLARARSVGSYSDAWRVSTRLERLALTATSSLKILQDTLELTIHADALVVGDMLWVHQNDVGLMAVVKTLEPINNAQTQQLKVRLDKLEWFSSQLQKSLDPQTVQAKIGDIGDEIHPLPLELKIEPEVKPEQAPIDFSSLNLQVERLRLELQITDGNGQQTGLPNLGFDSRHPRFWRALPTDEALYEKLEVEWKLKLSPDTQTSNWAKTHLEVGSSLPGLWQDALMTGFGLAGLEGWETKPNFIPLQNDLSETTYPIGLQLEPNVALGRLKVQESALRRDGLADFNQGLFLDAGLRQSQVSTLISNADSIRYEGSSPRSRLNGIHAFLGIDEVTLIAAPDAVHRGWNVITPNLLPATNPPPVKVNINTGFEVCNVPLSEAPKLILKSAPNQAGDFSLGWTINNVPSSLQAALRYRIEEYSSQTEPQVFESLEGFWNATFQAPGNYIYRVRAELEGLGKCESTVYSPWSNLLSVQVKPIGNLQLEEEQTYKPDVLLRVQRAMLRMSAARGDVFAVLSLPAHYREAAVLEHLHKLRTLNGLSLEESIDLEVPVLSAGEASALSYGAVYHPWLIELERKDNKQQNATRVHAPSLRLLPPDGAVLGVYADRSLTRGAWIAPANQALRGVVALEHHFNPAKRLELLEATLNPIWQEPQGFYCLSAQTLSSDPDLIEVNVRRLLSLLRRLALRIGSRLVFENNGGALQRLAERLFEGLLEQMFKRGAFKGRNAASSYRVRAGAEVNPPNHLETGRFVIEIRVAPSKPLYFLTVRLVQNGDHGLLI